jgi:hypothetical protein
MFFCVQKIAYNKVENNKKLTIKIMEHKTAYWIASNEVYSITFLVPD